MTQLFIIESDEVQELVIGRESATERFEELDDGETEMVLYQVGNINQYRRSSPE